MAGRLANRSVVMAHDPHASARKAKRRDLPSGSNACGYGVAQKCVERSRQMAGRLADRSAVMAHDPYASARKAKWHALQPGSRLVRMALHDITF